MHGAGEDLEQIEALLRGHAEARVLDLGCGGGHVSYRASPHVASVVACDLTRDMLDAVERTAAARGLSNITVRQAAAEALPFPDAASTSYCAVSPRIIGTGWRPDYARCGACVRAPAEAC